MQQIQLCRAAAVLSALALTLNACGAASSTSSVPVETKATTEAAEHYPVTITNYNYAGDEIEYTYSQAPERVVAVYQGSIETMIALGLEDHVIASYGLDNEVKAEWLDGCRYALPGRRFCARQGNCYDAAARYDSFLGVPLQRQDDR